jgi:acyl carrier protein
MESTIFDKVQETLASALGVEKSDIKPEASLTRDLGAESIDFIDIMFRLEKTFDIKIPSGDLFPGNILNDPRFVQNGSVTAAGINELRTKLPYLDVDTFSRDPQIARLGDFFTVKMVLDYLSDRLAKNVRTTP